MKRGVDLHRNQPSKIVYLKYITNLYSGLVQTLFFLTNSMNFIYLNMCSI